MDTTPQDNSTQSISDDQELAKALAGVLPEDSDTTSSTSPTGLQFEETPAPLSPVAPVIPDVPEAPAPLATDFSGFIPPTPLSETPALKSSSSDLDSIKLDALNELRPLMDKVDLPADEKFDTYLMLIRSSDDSSLIAPAHTAAQNITDEKRKAEALLEIIKEIDYLSRKDQPAKS